MTNQRYNITAYMTLRRTITNTLQRLDITPIFAADKAEIDDLQEHLITNKPSGSLKKTIIVFELEHLEGFAWQRSVEFCSNLDIPTLGIIPGNYSNVRDVDVLFTDFIFVPFVEDELLLRAKKLLTSTKNVSEQNIVVHDHLVISPHSYEVTLNGRRVHLRFKEYELLLLLASNPGRVYDRETLLNHIWGYDYFGGTRTVDVHIRRLRSKIEQPDSQFIETIWNVGYRFRPVRTD